MSPTYLDATANPRAVAPPLRGSITADVCIIGGGLTGLSAALRLAERGARVVVLEAETIGAGASGRSGGQLIPGFRHGAVAMIARFGEAGARALIDLTYAARERMVATVAAHAIDCDLQLTGHLTAAAFAGDLPDLAAELTAMRRLGLGGQTMLDAVGVQQHVASTAYFGGLHDTAGGHVHPLNYVGGLAAAARAAGVAVYEHCPALAVDPGAVVPGVGATVATADGQVDAVTVVIACDARVDGVTVCGRPTPGARRMMPVWSYSVATEPLGAQAAALLPTNAAVSDTRFALDYFRRSADNRLLFSGGERYTLAPLGDVAGFVRRQLARAFPALAAVGIDFAWPGTVAVTTSRFPHVGRDAGIYWAHGYSGHGMLLAQASGHAVADAIMGDCGAFDALAALPTRDWPGGATLRQPLYTAGMAYYGLRDRLRGTRPNRWLAATEGSA